MKSYNAMNKSRADYIRKLYDNKTNAYTQVELAEMFYMSQSSINRILNWAVWNEKN